MPGRGGGGVGTTYLDEERVPDEVGLLPLAQREEVVGADRPEEPHTTARHA